MATRRMLAVSSARAIRTTANTILLLRLSLTLGSITGAKPTSTAKSSVRDDAWVFLASFHSGSADATVDLDPALLAATSRFGRGDLPPGGLPLSDAFCSLKLRGLGPSLLVLRTGLLGETSASRSTTDAERFRRLCPRRPLLLLLLLLFLFLRLPRFCG